MIGETVTGYAPGTPTGTDDTQGNPVLGADVTFSFVTLAPCAPIRAEETAEDYGAAIITGWKIFAAADLVLDPRSVLTIRGVGGWQVEGEVGRWNRSSDGSGRGVEFAVRRSG